MGSETNKQIAEIWSAAYGRDLGEDEGAEIARNLVGFFAILDEWRRQDEDLAVEADGPPFLDRA